MIGKLKAVGPSRGKTFLEDPGGKWKGERKREDWVFEPEFEVEKEIEWGGAGKIQRMVKGLTVGKAGTERKGFYIKRGLKSY